MEHGAYPVGGPVPGPFGPGDPRPQARRGLAVALLAVLLTASAGIGVWAHNRMLALAEGVDAAWAQVESNFQRRADLIPRLVQVVNRYAQHEAELLGAVTRDRAALGRAPRDDASLEALARQEAAVGRGVRAVLAVAERYPELRSADQFLELQAQLEGSENRINVARMFFNDAVRDYNAALVQIPTRFVAQGMAPRPYFRADDGTRVAGPLAFD